MASAWWAWLPAEWGLTPRGPEEMGRVLWHELVARSRRERAPAVFGAEVRGAPSRVIAPERVRIELSSAAWRRVMAGSESNAVSERVRAALERHCHANRDRIRWRGGSAPKVDLQLVSHRFPALLLREVSPGDRDERLVILGWLVDETTGRRHALLDSVQRVTLGPDGASYDVLTDGRVAIVEQVRGRLSWLRSRNLVLAAGQRGTLHAREGAGVVLTFESGGTNRSPTKTPPVTKDRGAPSAGLPVQLGVDDLPWSLDLVVLDGNGFLRLAPPWHDPIVELVGGSGGVLAVDGVLHSLTPGQHPLPLPARLHVAGGRVIDLLRSDGMITINEWGTEMPVTSGIAS